MKRYFNNHKLLPVTNIILICVLLVCIFYTDLVGKIFLGVCILALLLCLCGIWAKNNSLIGASHLMFATTIVVGTFLGRKIINYILMVLLVFVILTRHVRGNCMYDDYTIKYMDIIPLNGKEIDIFFLILLIVNMCYVIIL